MSSKRNREPLDFTKVIKFIDPIIQTLLIIMTIYMFDKKGIRYQKFMVFTVQWQLISLVLHYFLHFSGKKKLERYIALASLATWFVTFQYIYKSNKLVEVYGKVILGAGFTGIGLYVSIFCISWLALVSWYFYICVSETQTLMKKRRKSKK